MKGFLVSLWCGACVLRGVDKRNYFDSSKVCYFRCKKRIHRFRWHACHHLLLVRMFLTSDHPMWLLYASEFARPPCRSSLSLSGLACGPFSSILYTKSWFEFCSWWGMLGAWHLQPILWGQNGHLWLDGSPLAQTHRYLQLWAYWMPSHVYGTRVEDRALEISVPVGRWGAIGSNAKA